MAVIRPVRVQSVKEALSNACELGDLVRGESVNHVPTDVGDGPWRGVLDLGPSKALLTGIGTAGGLRAIDAGSLRRCSAIQPHHGQI
jgi:hypothetical protein